MILAEQFGKLMLSCTENASGREILWGECLFNKIAVCACALLVLFFLSDFFRLIPYLFECLTMRRGHINLEHNIRFARTRNQFFYICLVIISLIADYYGLYSADFMKKIPLGWSAAAVLGLLALYFLIRAFLYATSSPRALRGDNKLAAENSTKTYTLFLTFIFLLTILVLRLFDVGLESGRTALTIEAAAVFAVSAIQTARILGSVCNVFSTFLYLCALELAPAAILIASALVC